MTLRVRHKLLMCAAVLAASGAQARVGETLAQSEARYGGPGQEVRDADALILKNAKNVVYNHGDWIITAAFINDVTARIQYEKAGPQLQARQKLGREEVAEIIEAEDARGWTVFNETTQKAGKPYAGEGHPPPVLRSASGLTARYRVFSVVVESPSAARHESGLTTQQKLKPVSRTRVAL